MKISQALLLRAYPPTPPQVHTRIDETLLALHRQAAQLPPRRYAKRLRFATVLLALLVLLTAIGVAAGIHFGVFDFMEQFFGQTGMLPEATHLIQTELTRMETAHTTVTVSQAVYDGGNLRLVYSVREKGAALPISAEELNNAGSAFRKALEADGVSPWGCDWFSVDGTEYAMTAGSTGATIPGSENGEILCYMDISLASSGIIPQDDFNVSLPIVRQGKNAWQTLDFTVKARMAASNQPAKQVNGATVTVRSAFLSPVRGYVNLHIQIDDGLPLLQASLLLADWQDAVLVDGQGKELAKRCEFQVLAEEEGASCDYGYTFFPTDAAQVYIAPTVVDKNDRWFPDMTQAIQIK